MLEFLTWTVVAKTLVYVILGFLVVSVLAILAVALHDNNGNTTWAKNTRPRNDGKDHS